MINIEEIAQGREVFENTRLGDDERFRLDSGGDINNEWNRWSYKAHDFPSLRLICDTTGEVRLLGQSGVLWSWENPIDALEWVGSTFNEAPMEGPPFKGGWIGHFSYDLGRWFETVPVKAINDLNWPLFELSWHDEVLAHDRATGKNFKILLKAPPAESSPVEWFMAQPTLRKWEWPHKSNFTREQYERAVGKALDYIAAGDVFQVNLSQRFELPMRRWPLDVYRELQKKFPAGFGALLYYENHALISNSPELFLRVDGRQVTTRPIKGTRPRREGMERELRNSAKDQAELNMIVDLERNDLGRVCEIGSVKVKSARDIEALPTVYHGVATIEGMLREDVRLVELLRATFPGGSVTGAPKIRAMEIIEELEPSRRGPYCGAIGYLSADGQIGLNVAIRTIVMKDSVAYVSVGGGIVADSNPKDEYEETLVKASAMFDVLGVGPC